MLDKNISSLLKKHQNDLCSFPTYFYPPLILYYSWIRNVFDVRTQIYKEYTKRLNDFEQNETSIKNITPSNILQETVAIQISMQSDNYGEIIRLSPDYFTHLGTPQTNTSNPNNQLNNYPVGENVSILIPEIFKEIHGGVIKDTSKLYKMSNIIREALIIKLNGYLAKCKMVIKILPNI